MWYTVAMNTRRDLTEQTFGRLTALSFVSSKLTNTSSMSQWFCVCSCGNEVTVFTQNLLRGNTKSCGCLNDDSRMGNKRSSTHGETLSPTWISWQAMRRRCLNPSDEHYPIYGGRGITIDPRWDSYEIFREDMGERPDGETLDRIDTNGNYYKENCCWSTHPEQSENRRDNRNFTIDGITHTVAGWAKIYGLPRGVVYNRIDAGWNIGRALITPVRQHK